jgi:hypothetical protein
VDWCQAQRISQLDHSRLLEYRAMSPLAQTLRNTPNRGAAEQKSLGFVATLEA